MEHLYNGYEVDFDQAAFPLSTDSMVLADFVRLPRNARVLDLGSGCGTLGTLLCAKDSTCHVTGIEISSESHKMALKNIHHNRLDERMANIHGDLRDIPVDNYHVCISNPPYFSGGPASKTVPIARRNDLCSSEELLSAAARSLRFGGDFYLVHKPEKLAEICGAASKYKLEAKRLRLVRHKQSTPVILVLLQFRKGGKPGLKWEDLVLFHDDDSPTEAYKSIYHL